MSTLINFIVSVLLIATLVLIEDVKSNDFESSCGPNEQYSMCDTQCPRTCADRGEFPKLCNHMCNVGCVCKSGYVRQFDKDSPCIRESECQ